MVARQSNTSVALRRGFTLVEGLIASAILAFAVGAVCTAYSASYQQERAVDELTCGTSLARELMEEISARPYIASGEVAVPGPDAGESERSSFDSVRDYRGYRDVTSGLRMLNGQSLPAIHGTYTRTVSIEYRDSPSGPARTWGDFALVQVQVQGPSGQTVRLYQLFTAAKVM